MTGVDRAAVREQIRAGINTAIANSGHPESHTGWSPSAEVDRVTDAVMARVTPALDRDRMAAAIDPDAFDEGKPRSKHHAAVIQWAARQHMAYTAADNLLAAGVIRSEAAVKAEALEEAVASGEFPGLTMAREWVAARAKSIRAGDQS